MLPVPYELEQKKKGEKKEEKIEYKSHTIPGRFYKSSFFLFCHISQPIFIEKRWCTNGCKTPFQYSAKTDVVKVIQKRITEKNLFLLAYNSGQIHAMGMKEPIVVQEFNNKIKKESKNMKTLMIEQENRNPNNKDSFAFRLDYIIKKRRFTAKEVSIRTEDKEKGIKAIHPATLSLYINGKSVPNHAYTRRLAKVLRVDTAWLTGDLPFECLDKPNPATDINQLIEVYRRLDATWQKCILAITRMVAIGMQYEDINKAK